MKNTLKINIYLIPLTTILLSDNIYRDASHATIQAKATIRFIVGLISYTLHYVDSYSLWGEPQPMGKNYIFGNNLAISKYNYIFGNKPICDLPLKTRHAQYHTKVFITIHYGMLMVKSRGVKIIARSRKDT